MSRPLRNSKLFFFVLLGLAILLAGTVLNVNALSPDTLPAPVAVPAAPAASPAIHNLARLSAPSSNWRPEPQPVPTAPSAKMPEPVAQPSGGNSSFSLPQTVGVLALLALAGVASAWAASLSSRLPSLRPVGLCLAALLLGACGSLPTAVQPTQPPSAYLSGALDWLEANAVRRDRVDWTALRSEASALAANAETTADTYPALMYATGQLGDWLTFFADPEQASTQGNYGLTALSPENLIVEVNPGGAAERAGLLLGDVIQSINGAPPRPWQKSPMVDFYIGASQTALQITVRRAGFAQPITVSLSFEEASHDRAPSGRQLSVGPHSLGYIELPYSGSTPMYPTEAQQVLRAVDQPAACGWIIDLRRNIGGNLWSYLSALGPVLGEGEVGGFEYADSTRETWAYWDGKVFWNNTERDESVVEGPLYRPRQPLAPVAVLVNRATAGAGELVMIAFIGRPGLRTFGEPTSGSPFLQAHTTLSDGAFLSVSGAYGTDRSGRAYSGPLAPDEGVATDWTLFGSDKDPVINAARVWLAAQPGCAP